MRWIALASRNAKEIYRDRVSVVLGIMMPGIMLVAFVMLNERLPMVEVFKVTNFTPGIIVFSFIFLMMFSAILLTKDRQKALLSRLLTTPLSTTDFILAYSLPFIPLALLQVIALYLFALPFGFELNIDVLWSFVVYLPIAYALIGFGLILGSVLTENQVSGVGSLIFVVVSFLSGAWMDLKMIGGSFETFAYYLPFAHAVDASRQILHGASLYEISHSLLWMVGYAIVLNLLGAWLFQHSTKE
jgi:ABC-2 type transport system permease protein